MTRGVSLDKTRRKARLTQDQKKLLGWMTDQERAEAIFHFVVEICNADLSQIRSSSRQRNVTKARWLMLLLLRCLTDCSSAEIADTLYRDRSTLYALLVSARRWKRAERDQYAAIEQRCIWMLFKRCEAISENRSPVLEKG